MIPSQLVQGELRTQGASCCAKLPLSLASDSGRPRPSDSVQPSSDAANEARIIREDQRLLADVAAGRPGAVDRLSLRMRCVARILAALNARMGHVLDSHDLADLAQETLLVILRKLHLYEGRASLQGWAYRIAYFEFMNCVRRRWRREGKAASEGEEVIERGVEGHDPWRFEELHRALERIPVKEAQIVRLKHLEELTFDQISQAVSTPRSTVKARYYRGLEALRELLAPAPAPRDAARPHPAAADAGPSNEGKRRR